MQHDSKRTRFLRFATKFTFIIGTLFALILHFGASATEKVSAKPAALIDNFSNSINNNFGYPRQFINDTVVGGNTQAQQEVSNGKIHLSGEVVPPRGQPGWASTVLLLSGEAQSIDASHYQGLRIRIKINTGSVSISVNSNDVKNFDYHATVINAATDGKYHEITIPFNSLQRMWSEQTQLNTKALNSLSIVAFGLKKTAFDFEIDEISFY
ncbi:CIA30 family protein [Glaciecola petra]|uniref:CIA30 family protein n=1 Tax=Glaciecola petra TaxID=3075602 RepID=A0ABU2ZRE6_9ALTE|nr:CIA30 family protein [Aestuariibacter sp. P117]MDT0594966.1 CIA30 family protein [Aestuariibacter sp. P117]